MQKSSLLNVQEGLARWEGHEGDVLHHIPPYDVMECRVCGFTHIVPIPDESQVNRLYTQQYYGVEKPAYLERHMQDMAWWNLVYEDRYATFEKLLGPGPHRVLDVGSGPGTFALFGQERGWNTLGVEPSKQAAAHARELGVTILEGVFDADMAKTIGKVDVVHVSEVLEHISRPASMLCLIHDVLRPGGVLCVVVPNDENPLQLGYCRLTNCAPWWIAPPHHVNYFNSHSMVSLLRQCGFTLECRESTFPLEMFLFMGDHYIGDDEMGRRCHGKRMQWEKNLVEAGLGTVRKALYEALADQGLGRELVVYARKPFPEDGFDTEADA